MQTFKNMKVSTRREFFIYRFSVISLPSPKIQWKQEERLSPINKRCQCRPRADTYSHRFPPAQNTVFEV